MKIESTMNFLIFTALITFLDSACFGLGIGLALIIYALRGKSVLNRKESALKLKLESPLD